MWEIMATLGEGEGPGPKGPFIIYGGGWHRREMFFVAKILLTQPIKESKI
jgi:hypothetical protein